MFPFFEMTSWNALLLCGLIIHDLRILQNTNNFINSLVEGLNEVDVYMHPRYNNSNHHTKCLIDTEGHLSCNIFPNCIEKWEK